MATARKSTKAPAPAKKPAKLTNATLMHVAYHPEAKLLRANIQQDLTIGASTERVGRDQDIALEDIPADIAEDLDVIFQRIADHVGADPFKAE